MIRTVWKKHTHVILLSGVSILLVGTIALGVYAMRLEKRLNNCVSQHNKLVDYLATYFEANEGRRATPEHSPSAVIQATDDVPKVVSFNDILRVVPLADGAPSLSEGLGSAGGAARLCPSDADADADADGLSDVSSDDTITVHVDSEEEEHD